MGEGSNVEALRGIFSSGVANATFLNTGKTDGSNPALNALQNASASANSGKETASIVLRGYPLLKAKTTLEITGVGKGSGVWYCKTVVQQWNIAHGYLTVAQLIRGNSDESGSGSAGGGPVADLPTTTS